MSLCQLANTEVLRKEQAYLGGGFIPDLLGNLTRGGFRLGQNHKPGGDPAKSQKEDRLANSVKHSRVVEPIVSPVESVHHKQSGLVGNKSLSLHDVLQTVVSVSSAWVHW